MNKVMLRGNLTRDIDVKTYNTANGVFTVADTGIAVSKWQGKDKEPKTSFFNLKATNKMAEYVALNFFKGDYVIIVGELVSEEYEKDGEKRTAVKILLNEIYKLQKKEKTESTEQGQYVPDADVSMIRDEDVPF